MLRRYGYAIAQLPSNQLHGEKNTADDETNCFWELILLASSAVSAKS